MSRLPIRAGLGQAFGLNPAVYNRLGMKGHNGWDFPAATGSPVVAPESGTVTAGWDSTGYGNLVTLQGDSGWTHKLAHLQKFGKTGRVNEGDVIGYVNNTGFSTGPHLHWGTRPPRYNQNNGYYGFVDPQIFLDGQKGASSLPYSDQDYKAAKSSAINGIYWREMDRGANQKDVDAWINQNLDDLEKALHDPDNPVSEEKRQVIIKLFKEYFGRTPSDKEIRQRTKQNLVEIRRDFEASEEHKIYKKK